jgi:hypothetical protein
MDMAADLWLPALSPFGGFHHFLCDNSSYTLLLHFEMSTHSSVPKKAPEMAETTDRSSPDLPANPGKRDACKALLHLSATAYS